MTKILLADDHALIRDGLRGQLRNFDGEVTMLEARDWNETFAAAAAHPDLELALIDLNMPGREGIAALTALLRENPGLPVLVISASEDLQDMRDALRVGAMGYVTKSEPAAVMRSAMRLVLDGGMYVPLALAAHGLDTQIEPAHTAEATELTARQRDVLRLIVEGKSNKEIAQTLNLANATVKVHLSAVFRALNVDNRTQAAIAAERLGLHRAAPAR